MSGRLAAGAAADATAVPIELEPVAREQSVAGSPHTGGVVLDVSPSGELGVWEMTPGTMSDVETDELFVVLAGDATVEFADPPLPTIEVGPGSVVRLEAGMRTVWTVRETLRKIYLTP